MSDSFNEFKKSLKSIAEKNKAREFKKKKYEETPEGRMKQLQTIGAKDKIRKYYQEIDRMGNDPTKKKLIESREKKIASLRKEFDL